MDLLVKRCLWFTLVTVLTITALFIYNRSGDTFRAIRHLNISYILICFALLFVDLMLGSWRNHLFIRKLKPGISHWVSFRANVANMFMGAVTPAHGGAGPAQIYVYMQAGVSFIDAFTVSLVNLGATLIFMPLAGLLAVFFMDDHLIHGIVPHLLRYGFGFFTLFLLGFLLSFWKPLWIGVFIHKLASFVAILWPKKKERLLQ
jgi:uncharacterized protein (TIRG00374 family)